MSGGKSLHPVAEYFVNDVRYLCKGSVSSSPPQFSIGDSVEIVYDPEKPDSALIDSFIEWIFPIGFVVGGVTHTAMGLGLRWLVKIQSQKANS